MTERAGASPSSEAGGEAMRCSSCQHDNDQGVRSCARCGRPLGPVDLERVRAQLRRWQERLLDLTKANPLLGINRSRVSKLRVVEPAPHRLFSDFAVPDDATLTLPRVVRQPRSDGETSAGDEGPEYRIEPGDLGFDAGPVDLHRRLRRIHDNARTTVEERGVTTLHLSFGVLRWEDPLLGLSICPLWLIPCAIESRGPSAPLRLTRADEEMQLNPALALYLRERHHVELPDPPDDPTAASLTSFLDGVQAAVRELDWKVEPEVWLSTYSFESLVIYQDLKALAEMAAGNEVVAALARAAAPREGSEALGEDGLDALPTPDKVPVPVLPTDSSQIAALATARLWRNVVVHGPPGTGKSQTIANLIADALAQGKKVLFVSAKMAALDVVHDRLTALGLDRFCLEAHSTKAGKVKIIEDLRQTLEAAQDARGPSGDDGLDDLLRVREELNAYVRELHERRAPLGLSIYEALGRVEKLRWAPEVRGALPWDEPLVVPRLDLRAALEALRDLAAQAEVFDRRATHPWRGLAVEPGAPPRRDVLEADLLALREALVALAPNLAAVALLATTAARFRGAAALRRAFEAGGLSPSATALPLTADLKQHAAAVAGAVLSPTLVETPPRLDRAWPDGLVDGVPSAQAPLGALRVRCEELLSAQPKFHEWLALAHTLHRCRQLRLGPFIEALGTLSVHGVPQAFERRFYTAWAESAMGGSPTLVAFSGARRDELIARYRELDTAARRASLARAIGTAALPARQIAAARGGGGEASQVGVLRREMEKRRRLKPLRKLFAEIPVVLQALKPCFLMSPLSVSTFLKPGALAFDLVIFDEASQLPTPQAVPAILRAKQVVVAGDRNQLPPTAFFESSIILDEDASDAALREEFEPLESLLDDSVAIFPTFEQAHLRWHYRSRDERLIKFSNHYFYRDRPLITFPSVAADAADQGVSLVYVPDGVWDRGGSRTNRAEARRVAEIVVDQISRHPERSLGVVAMSVAQREAIEEELEALLPDHPDLAPLLDTQSPEPFFIKALENVQGDERDTMVISVGYGRNQTGSVTYNFGPLNQEGGWRRLNVLVTRARWHTILVTSLRSHELAGVNPENRGAVALRNFIAYCEQGGALPAEPVTVTDAETNDFEDAVAEALRAHGFHVDEQVGASTYRIDLAIRDRRDPRRYVLGVECDGATYHGSRTARDRDLLRQEVLREQGWRLYRIWSTEWFRDRDAALARLIRAVEQASEAPLADSVPAPPVAPAKPIGARKDTPGPPAPSPVPDAPSVERRYRPGEPYRKCRGSGRREALLDPKFVGELVEQVVRVVEAEGPIHLEVLLERLKELSGVDRAGSNVQRNVERAIAVAVSRRRVERGGEFLRRPGAELAVFRLPGDGVQRSLAQIASEEIALAILHKVEDQFGYQRDGLSRTVAELFGFERLPPGGAEIVGTVVDGMIERGVLTTSGPYVYLVR